MASVVLGSSGWVRLAATVALVVLLAGCGDAGGPQRTYRVVGTLQIGDTSQIDVRYKAQTSSCFGRGRYDGIAEGAPVVVEDASASSVSTGRLGQGRLVYDPRELEAGAGIAQPQGCVLGFVVRGVPPVGDSWTVRIGKHRFDLPADKTNNLSLSLG